LNFKKTIYLFYYSKRCFEKKQSVTFEKYIRNAFSGGIQYQHKVNGTAGLTAFEGILSAHHLLQANVKTVLNNPALLKEVFGHSTETIVADDMY